MNSRKRNRLIGFDYSEGNAYFITICIHNNLHILSEIINEQSILTPAGMMIRSWWLELENKYKDVTLDEYIIMPNHMHGIIIINEHVGDDLRVVPNKTDRLSLPEIIQWFKTMTTNEYIEGVKQNLYKPFDKHLWQRSYYDRIIRDEKEFGNIQTYIYYNPLKWGLEKNNPENLS